MANPEKRSDLYPQTARSNPNQKLSPQLNGKDSCIPHDQQSGSNPDIEGRTKQTNDSGLHEDQIDNRGTNKEPYNEDDEM